jgi:hypothetical protein
VYGGGGGGAESVPTNTALLLTCQIRKIVFSGEIITFFHSKRNNQTNTYYLVFLALVNDERNVTVSFSSDYRGYAKKTLKSSELIGLYKK